MVLEGFGFPHKKTVQIVRRRCIYGLLQYVLDLLPGFLLAGLAVTHPQGGNLDVGSSGSILSCYKQTKTGMWVLCPEGPPPAGRNHGDLLLCELDKGTF